MLVIDSDLHKPFIGARLIKQEAERLRSGKDAELKSPDTIQSRDKGNTGPNNSEVVIIRQ